MELKLDHNYRQQIQILPRVIKHPAPVVVVVKKRKIITKKKLISGQHFEAFENEKPLSLYLSRPHLSNTIFLINNLERDTHFFSFLFFIENHYYSNIETIIF